MDPIFFKSCPVQMRWRDSEEGGHRASVQLPTPKNCLAWNGATSFSSADAKNSEPLLVVRRGPAEKEAKGKDPMTVLTVAMDAHQVI